MGMKGVEFDNKRTYSHRMALKTTIIIITITTILYSLGKIHNHISSHCSSQKNVYINNIKYSIQKILLRHYILFCPPSNLLPPPYSFYHQPPYNLGSSHFDPLCFSWSAFCPLIIHSEDFFPSFSAFLNFFSISNGFGLSKPLFTSGIAWIFFTHFWISLLFPWWWLVYFIYFEGGKERRMGNGRERF